MAENFHFLAQFMRQWRQLNRIILKGQEMPSRHIVRETPLFTRGMEKLQADGEFNREWRKFWDRLAVLDNSRFAELLPLFITEVRRFRLQYRRTDGVSDAAGEFFRKTVTAESQPLGYCFDDALRFAKTYEKTKLRIEECLGGLFEIHGDGFGDLVDSILLAGPDFLKRIESDRVPFRDEEEFYDALQVVAEQSCENDPLDEYRELLVGENYVAFNLQAQAQRYWLNLLAFEIKPAESHLLSLD